MPDILGSAPAASLSTLPGATIIRRIRRLLFWAAGTALVYSALATASKGGCPGGVTGDGGYLDANGDPTAVAPMCVNLTLRPSSLIIIMIGAAVLVAISLVLRRAHSEAAAIRILDRTAIVIVVVTVGWTVLTMVSFLSIPLDGWDGTGPFFIPFSFGNIDVDISPMNTTTG